MKNVEIRRVVSGFAPVVVLLLMAVVTQAQQFQVTTTYAAKFICGVQLQGAMSIPVDAQAGRYSSKINVHNNTGIPIRFRKSIISLRGGQTPTNPQFRVNEALQPNQAMEVVCRDIYAHLNIGPTNQLPPYIEGFVIFEVFFSAPPVTLPLDPLDVAGIYTYRGDIPNVPTSAGASGVSIDVVVYPAKNNRHPLQ